MIEKRFSQLIRDVNESADFVIEYENEEKKSEGPIVGRKMMNEIEVNSQILYEIISKLKVDKELIERKIYNLQKENTSYKQLNTTLSQNLFESKEELKILRNKKKVKHTIKLPIKRSRKNSQVENKLMNLEQNEFFGDLSNIASDCKDGEFFSFYQDTNHLIHIDSYAHLA